jgi:hypothetical protein
MFENLSAAEVIQWSALIFAAGFIGFFGKSFGRTVLSFFQKKKEAEALEPPARVPTSGEGLPSGPGKGLEPGDKTAKDEQKLIKKAVKAQEKARKKQGR